MNKYAIGLVIQNSDTISKWNNIADQLTSLFQAATVVVDENGQFERFTLKDIPDAEIWLFIAIASSRAVRRLAALTLLILYSYTQ